MRTDRLGPVAVAAAVLVLAGCGGDTDVRDEPTGAASPDEPTADETEETIVPQATSSLPVGPLGEQVELARADLAERLGVDVADVVVDSADEVTWRDGSAGCPQPGMNYTQALVDGVRIVLSVDGQRYDYHAAGTQPPRYCADPQEPLPPGTGGHGDR